MGLRIRTIISSLVAHAEEDLESTLEGIYLGTKVKDAIAGRKVITENK